MVLTFTGHVYALAVHFLHDYGGVEGVAGCAGWAEYGAIITVLEIIQLNWRKTNSIYYGFSHITYPGEYPESR